MGRLLFILVALVALAVPWVAVARQPWTAERLLVSRQRRQAYTFQYSLLRLTIQ